MNRYISSMTLSHRDGVIIMSGLEINISDDWSNQELHVTHLYTSIRLKYIYVKAS